LGGAFISAALVQGEEARGDKGLLDRARDAILGEKEEQRRGEGSERR
jgi:hypothetical protein